MAAESECVNAWNAPREASAAVMSRTATGLVLKAHTCGGQDHITLLQIIAATRTVQGVATPSPHNPAWRP